MSQTSAKATNDLDNTGLDALMAKLSEQQMLLDTHKDSAKAKGCMTVAVDKDGSVSNSVPPTPATDTFSTTPPTEKDEDEKDMVSSEKETEMERLKKELDAAKNRIARQEQELSDNRAMKQAQDHTRTGLPGTTNPAKTEGVDRTIVDMQEAFNASRSLPTYGSQDDARSDISETLSAMALNTRGPTAWGPPTGMGGNMQGAGNVWNPAAARPWINRPMAAPLQPIMVPPPQQFRGFSGTKSPVLDGSGNILPDFAQFQGNHGNRRSNLPSVRSSSSLGQNRGNIWEPYSNNGDPTGFMGMNTPSIQPMGMFQGPVGYQPRPIGTPLSPTAAEFTSTGGMARWNAAVC